MKKFLSNTWPLWTLITIAALLTLFTISESIQQADGLAQVGSRLIFELDVGGSQVLQWGMINTEETQREIQFYATGEGSELLHFEEFALMEPGEFRNFDFIVVVPDDHPDNIEYQITLNALDRGEPLPEGVTGIQVQMQMQQNPRIYIGDNPVYTMPKIVEEKETIPEPKIPSNQPIVVIEEAPKGETLEEKLARIQAANQKNIKVEPTTPVKEITQSAPIIDEEPTMDPEPVPDPEPISVKKQDCDFWCWLLSLFDWF